MAHSKESIRAIAEWDQIRADIQRMFSLMQKKIAQEVASKLVDEIRANGSVYELIRAELALTALVDGLQGRMTL